MDPISLAALATLAIGGATAAAGVVSAGAAVGTLVHTSRKDRREEGQAATQVQSNQTPSPYNSYPMPHAENVTHYYGTSGSGRVRIGSDGRSISAGGSAPGDLTFGYCSRTFAYSSAPTGPGSSPNNFNFNFNFNQSQAPPQQHFPPFLMPPSQQQPQQQLGGFVQQSQYGSSRPASSYGGYNSPQRVSEYATYGQGAAEDQTVHRMRSFR